MLTASISQRHRCQLLLLASLMLCLCVLLLLVVQPSRHGHFFTATGTAHTVTFDGFALDSTHSQDEGEGGVGGGAPKELVRDLVKKYRVNFNAELPPGETRTAWEIAADWVGEREVIPEHAPELGAVLHALSTSPILAVDNSFEGTQLKLIMTLHGGQRVVFKPKWYERDMILEGAPSAGRDRHNGEVVAFHMSRLLEFRRTPLAVGRTISLSGDLLPSVPDDMLDSFYEEDGETCFYGSCVACEKENALCTRGDSFEGAVILWLPRHVHLKEGRNPWRTTFKDRILTRLNVTQQGPEDYCSIVRGMAPFANSSTLILDLIDVTVFDYLTGNADRHHYEFVKNGMLVMLDNGKSFGNPYQDEWSILAPLYQCCTIRRGTWGRLKAMSGGVLSSVLREVLKDEPLHPVVTQQHMQALDRRLNKVLQEIDRCLAKHPPSSVLL